MMRKIIDLSLTTSNPLYEGCSVEEVAGRQVMTTPLPEAVNIVGRNADEIVKADSERDEVVLTGAMAIWSYLIVFHAVVHAYRRVYYSDGRGGAELLIAAHG
jgi:hypothetical protein